jgi:hypothetical protein
MNAVIASYVKRRMSRITASAMRKRSMVGIYAGKRCRVASHEYPREMRAIKKRSAMVFQK